ncbi:MAG: amidohydrolase family protein [Candidatus Omnitrophota bacterium]
MQIFDSHSHYLPVKFRENVSFYPPVWSDLGKLIDFMDKNEIKKSLILYPTTDAAKKLGDVNEAKIYNDELSCDLEKYKDKLVPAFILPQTSRHSLLEETKRAVHELGLKVLSISSSYKSRYLDDEFYFELYEFLSQNNIPIFVHSQTQMPLGSERFFDPLLTPVMQYLFDLSACMGKLIMAGIGNKFPNLKFVFAHFAGVIPFLAKRFDTTYSMLRGINVVKDLGQVPTSILKKFYVDTSGVSSINVINCAIEVFSKDNILWGSDWPANKDAIESISLVKNLNFSDSILRDNFKRIIN